MTGMQLVWAAFLVGVSRFALQVLAVDPVSVDPSTGHYVDRQRRVRIFHGMNVVYKKPPWLPPSDTFDADRSLDAETMANLRTWGFNVVRLGVMWPGVEPSLGRIDHEYLSNISALTARLAEFGIYTIVDLHQDVGSLRFCGEGFPEHYVDALLRDESSALARAAAFPAPPAHDLKLNDSGFPDAAACRQHRFTDCYHTDEVAALWAELYKLGSDMNLGFSRFWGAVAAHFRGASEVLAYELLNEPSNCFGASSMNCPKIFPFDTVTWGNKLEREQLVPLYRAASKAIRSAGAVQSIIYEANPNPKVRRQAFDKPVLAEDGQQGLAYHIYCEAGDGNGTLAGLECLLAQDLFARTYYPFLSSNTGVAGFMTEFGAVAGNNVGEIRHLNRVLRMADDHFQGWAYWQLKKYADFTTANAAESLYDEHGRLEERKLAVLSRTYAQAIAGVPQEMRFDPATARFELSFAPALIGNASVPTEIYLNEELHYPNGYGVAVESPDGCEITVDSTSRNMVYVVALDGCKHQTVKIAIWRKAKMSTPLIV